MRRIILVLSLLVLSTALLAACGQTSPAPLEGKGVKVDGGSYWDITPTQLMLMLENKDFLLVNVHIPYAGEIRDTDLFVPYNEIESNLSKFPHDKAAKVVLYCRSGSMSAISARALVNLGFTNVWNVDGGMVEWAKQGYDLIHKPQ